VQRKLLVRIGIIAATCVALTLAAVSWLGHRSTTGEEAFCVPDLAKAERDSDRSWDSARRLIQHYEMCPVADNKQSWEKARSLYRVWIARGNADATFEFAEDQINSHDPIAHREGERLMLFAAKLGQPHAIQEIQARRSKTP